MTLPCISCMWSPLGIFSRLDIWISLFELSSVYQILWVDFLLLSLVVLLHALYYKLQRYWASQHGVSSTGVAWPSIWGLLDKLPESRRTSPSYRLWVWHSVSITMNEFSGVPLSWNARPNFMFILLVLRQNIKHGLFLAKTRRTFQETSLQYHLKAKCCSVR